MQHSLNTVAAVTVVGVAEVPIAVADLMAARGLPAEAVDTMVAAFVAAVRAAASAYRAA